MVVRADLPRGIQAANLVHAAGESSPGDLAEGTNAVVLTTPDEASLYTLACRLEHQGVRFVRIVEPDPPHCGALMAVGLWPVPREEVKRHLSSLPLLR